MSILNYATAQTNKPESSAIPILTVCYEIKNNQDPDTVVDRRQPSYYSSIKSVKLRRIKSFFPTSSRFNPIAYKGGPYGCQNSNQKKNSGKQGQANGTALSTNATDGHVPARVYFG
jgi:hypothetical protein